METFESILPRLRQIEIFKAFSEDTPDNNRILRVLYDNIEIKKYSENDTIIKEGEFGKDFYILFSGSVRVEQATPAGDVLSLAVLDAEQNIFFGETALISEDTRSATVKAISQCSTIVLSNHAFEKIAQSEPIFGYQVVMCIARRMAHTIRSTNKDKATLYAALFNEIENIQ